jgi:hypothetical protein
VRDDVVRLAPTSSRSISLNPSSRSGMSVAATELLARTLVEIAARFCA